MMANIQFWWKPVTQSAKSHFQWRVVVSAVDPQDVLLELAARLAPEAGGAGTITTLPPSDTWNTRVVIFTPRDPEAVAMRVFEDNGAIGVVVGLDTMLTVDPVMGDLETPCLELLRSILAHGFSEERGLRHQIVRRWKRWQVPEV